MGLAAKWISIKHDYERKAPKYLGSEFCPNSKKQNHSPPARCCCASFWSRGGEQHIRNVSIDNNKIPETGTAAGDISACKPPSSPEEWDETQTEEQKE